MKFAVLDAVKVKFPRAVLKETAREKVDDETIDEIRIVDDGKKLDVSVDDEGEIEQTETEFAVTDLPKAITGTLHARSPKATIQKAELIVEFEDGKQDDESYEAVLHTDTEKTIEVVLTPKGRIVEESKKEGEKD